MKQALASLLCNPESAGALTLRDWDALVPQARNAMLAATLGKLLEQRGLDASLPPEVWRHLFSGICAHVKQREGLQYELKWLRRAFDEIGVPLLLLKGAAYAVADLRAGQGRMMSDIDLLVPAERIDEVEAVLLRHGWQAAEMDPYDQRYYREWMHEIPPLSHPRRGSTLDVHHTIIPPTARRNVDARLLFDAAIEVMPGVRVLAPVDMVIHSATHLFHEGEFGHGLRDLWDLHQLMSEFAASDTGFWEVLGRRAAELDLVDPLCYGLRYAKRCFATPVPDALLDELTRLRRGRAPLAVMDLLFDRVFVPDHPDCLLPGTALARFSLYVRSHHLRMPLRLLLPHLARKAWMGMRGPREKTEDTTEP